MLHCWQPSAYAMTVVPRRLDWRTSASPGSSRIGAEASAMRTASAGERAALPERESEATRRTPHSAAICSMTRNRPWFVSQARTVTVELPSNRLALRCACTCSSPGEDPDGDAILPIGQRSELRARSAQSKVAGRFNPAGVEAIGITEDSGNASANSGPLKFQQRAANSNAAVACNRIADNGNLRSGPAARAARFGTSDDFAEAMVPSMTCAAGTGGKTPSSP